VAQPPRVRRAPTVKAPPHAPVPPGTETLAAAIGWVLRSRGRGRGGRGRAEATQLMHQAHRDHLIAFFGDRAITDFRGAAGYELLLAYVQAEGPEDGGRGLRYCTLRKRLQTLHMALREAVKRGKLDALPPWPETPADSQPRERWLTLDEYLRLRAAIGAPWATWIDLGVWTGQHSSDLNTMTWAMVDLGGGAGAAAGEGRSLWLRRNTKNRATAEWLPMPAELRRNLAALYRSLEPKPAPNECIVGPWKHAGHRLRKACIRLGIAPCSPIDFRRTCATWWIESGGDKEALRKWLGHSGNSSMVERHYSKITPKMLDGGVDALDRAAAEGAR
jgi:integrase